MRQQEGAPFVINVLLKHQRRRETPQDRRNRARAQSSESETLVGLGHFKILGRVGFVAIWIEKPKRNRDNARVFDVLTGRRCCRLREVQRKGAGIGIPLFAHSDLWRA